MVGFMRVERRVGRVVECVEVRGLRVSRIRRFPGSWFVTMLVLFGQVVGLRTLIRNWFGVGCHFSLPGLQALVPGWDEDVYILRALKGFK